MADTGTQSQVDVSTIPDPDVRRALRAMVQLNHQLGVRVQKQQQEIEALLQMMCEKHVGSVGEFKRHMLRLQTADARSERLHDQISTVAAPTTQMRMPEIVESDGDRPRRYTL